MKHSDEFISFLGYRVLWWNALCERDYEKKLRLYGRNVFEFG